MQLSPNILDIRLLIRNHFRFACLLAFTDLHGNSHRFLEVGREWRDHKITKIF